jgi:threonyl-tRNA synthetase
MRKIELHLPDNSKIEVEAGIIAKEIISLLKLPEAKVLAGKLNGKLIDLSAKLEEGGDFAFITEGMEEGLNILRHSTAHCMAQAVMRLFDKVEFAIGPTIEDGFYYDFDLPHQLSTEDFPAIEAEMRKIIAENLPVERIEMSKAEAHAFLQKQNSKFKIEMLEEIDETKEKISFYKQGDFIDWCRGPHLDRTGKLKVFKLLNVAGAYWRGDERREMLQRIYGTAFFTEKELRQHLLILEEAKKRDHRKIGRDLDLFSLSDVSPGVPFWHPNGWVIFKELRNYVWELLFDRGYKEIFTPIILKSDIWKTSGHWDHYKNNMFFSEMEEELFGVKPMNCPGSMMVYKSTLHTYKEFPLRLCEWGVVHRHEKKGMMSGLTRVQGFTQDDAHIFCLPEQVEDEVIAMIELINEIYHKVGFTDVNMELSTRPLDSIGNDEMWGLAEQALRNALEKYGQPYQISPGEGAFYGPKIDFHIKDALKRGWQCGTIQVDMSMPERFDLEYVGSDNQRHRPVLLHRALMGSMERFIGILIEHTAGKFPTWLSPVQCMVIPISTDKFGEYALSVKEQLRREKIRVEIDLRDESLNKKIREAQLKKIPYMLVIGEREAAGGTVSVRQRNGKLPIQVYCVEFIELILREIKERKQELGIYEEKVSIFHQNRMTEIEKSRQEISQITGKSAKEIISDRNVFIIADSMKRLSETLSKLDESEELKRKISFQYGMDLAEKYFKTH